MTTISLTREQLIARLNEVLPEAEKYDAERMAQHQKDEAEFLKAFRKACREAAKMPYAEARKIHFDPKSLIPRKENERGFMRWAPDCPIPVAPRIKRALEVITIDQRKRYRLTATGQDRHVYDLVTWTRNPVDLSGGCR